MNVRFSKSNNFNFHADIRDVVNNGVVQAFPYPNLLITHDSYILNVKRTIVDYDDILNSGTEQGLYSREVSSSIFTGSGVTEYNVQITASVSDELYYDNFILLDTQGSQNTTYTSLIKQFQDFYRVELKNFLTANFREIYEEKTNFRVFINGLARYLDKVDQIGQNLITLTRIDEVPDEYVRYLGQVVGYESEDFTIENVALRSIISEIFTIYNIRGTEKGFQSFFNAIGYNATIIEKWYKGEERLVTEKPHVQTLGTDEIASGDEWKLSSLTAENDYSGLTHSGLTGGIDLIRGEGGEYRFVELYPTSIADYSFSMEDKFQETGKFSKSERLVNLLVESIKNTELVPSIINQMVNYVEFLKPIHLKLIITVLKDIDDNQEHWWETGNNDYTTDKADEGDPEDFNSSYLLDGVLAKEGNIPRDIDDIDESYLDGSKVIFQEGFNISPGFVDNESWVEDNSSYIFEITNTPSSPYDIYLTMDGHFNLGETERERYNLSNQDSWVYAAEVTIGEKLAHNSVYFNFTKSVIGSTIVNNGWSTLSADWSTISNDIVYLSGIQGVDYNINSSGLRVLNATSNSANVINIPLESGKRFFKSTNKATYIIDFSVDDINQSPLRNIFLSSDGNNDKIQVMTGLNKITVVASNIEGSSVTDISETTSGRHFFAISTSNLDGTNNKIAYYLDNSYKSSEIISAATRNGNIFADNTTPVYFGNRGNKNAVSSLKGTIKNFIVIEDIIKDATMSTIFNKLQNNENFYDDFTY
jgi:hypothetical protein